MGDKVKKHIIVRDDTKVYEIRRKKNILNELNLQEETSEKKDVERIMKRDINSFTCKIGEVKQFNMLKDNGTINIIQNNNYPITQKQESNEGGAKSKKLFLSYCHKDEKIADQIENYFYHSYGIELHRDKIDIGIWQSIKEYMNSISDMDYVILLISDTYLKSENCMYEVLETMRDREYKNKIFPAVINTEIYNPEVRANYVLYWQEKFEELKNKLQRISVQNIGKLGENLKRRQNISANIADFLECVSDMNNPSVEDVCTAVESKLKENKILV